MMAAMGIQYFDDFEEISKLVKKGKIYVPNLDNHRIYKEYQKIFDELYFKNKDLMHKISDLRK